MIAAAVVGRQVIVKTFSAESQTAAAVAGN